MKKILIIKHGSLGDIVFSLPAIDLIKQKYTNSLLHLLTEKKYISFLSKSNFFEELIEDSRKKNIFSSFFLLSKLLKKKYDIIIDLQNSQRTSFYNLFFRIFGSSLICSSRPYAHLRYFIPVQGEENSAQGLINQIKLLNIFRAQPTNFNWLKIKLEKEITQPCVLIIPGISQGNEHKQWQPEKYAEIAKYCESKNFKICVVGTKMDLKSAEQIFINCKNTMNKIDSSPPEVIYSIALKCSLIFSNDTGPGHIASLSNNNIIWLVNENKISKANIQNKKNNHKISATSLKTITTHEVIQYIEKNNLL